MRKSVRILAVFCIFTLLFSYVFVPGAANNDAKFDSYVNMGDNAVNNNYAIPHLFRQNGVYSNMQKAPLVVSGGVEYVPLSMFILYSYVEVNYSKTDDNFFLVNTKNNHYISFNMEGGIASTHDGELLKLPVKIFNKMKYVPARSVANVLGFVCETYDDPQKGVYALRISDGKSGTTLTQLISGYIDEYFPTKVENEPENDVPVIPEPPVVVEDPLEKVEDRNVAICYTNISSEHTADIIRTIEASRMKASFSVTKQDILTNPDLVKKLYFSGHGILVTADAEGNTPSEYAKSFVSGLEEANKALKLVMKKKVRMCTLPFDLPQEIAQSDEFKSAVREAGYMIFLPNVSTGDGPSYTGSAYTVSARIKSKITDGFAADRPANISALVWCSDKTRYYTIDAAQLVNKYEKFRFCAINEAFLHNS